MTQPTQIIEESDSGISIKWSNDIESTYNAAQLRRVCPCATCRDEWTGKKILDENQIPDDLTFSSIAIVGRYALNFHFSDGHETGIYAFAYLLTLSDS